MRNHSFRLVFLKIILFLSFLFSKEVCVAQLFSFKTYNLDNGLPQTTVESIMQDSKGYLWVSTHGGAARFDGINFNVFTTEHGLPSNSINEIKEDALGNIWIATSSGLSIYTMNDVNPRVFTFSQLGENGYQKVYSLVEGNGFMYVGTAMGLLKITAYLDEKTDSLNIKVSTMDKALQGRFIRRAFKDSKQAYWFATDSGLFYKSNTRFEQYTIESGLPTNDIYCIEEDGQGNIWCGTMLGCTRLILNRERKVTKMSSLSNTSHDFKRPVRSILRVSDKEMFVCFPALTHFTLSDTSVLGYCLQRQYLFENGINSNSLLSQIRDREGNFWFGGAENGLCRLSTFTFQSYNATFGACGSAVRGITSDDSGYYWMATNSCVSRFKESLDSRFPRAFTYQFIEKMKDNKKIELSSTWSALRDKSGALWFGGVGGLYRVKDGKIEWMSKRENYVGNVVMRIYEDRKGILWFASFNGTCCYNPVEDKFYEPFLPGSYFYKKRITSMYEDEYGNYYFGHSEGLVVKSKHKLTFYTTANGLPHNYVGVIVMDKQHRLWMATGKGISMFNGKKFTNYSVKDGLNSDTPYLLIFDNEDHLWVGTNRGLDKISLHADGSIKKIRFYGKDDGFMGIETNANAAYKDPDGNLWFGTMNGAVRYTASYDRINSMMPIISLEKLKIDFNEVSMLPNLAINHDKKNISFYYKAICLTNPSKVKYKYRLLGFMPDWSPETQEIFANFSNLSPGDYTFEVIACNNDGLWNARPATFTFSVLPPFWRQLWFYALCISIIVGGFYFYVKLKTRLLKRDNKILEDNVQKRTEELFIQNKRLEDANHEIELNRDMLALKNKDITDSISYAKRIQDTILPSPLEFQKHFPENFILYLPKDIVSGDFYWLETLDVKTQPGESTTESAQNKGPNSKLTFLAVADCTGHGVPGALVSVVCSNALNRVVKGLEITLPGKILDKVREIVIKTFEKTLGEVKDGMDISLCVLDHHNKIMYWSGANNPLWIVPDGKQEIIEIKGDKQPIGKFIRMTEFVTHQIPLNKGDSFYLFSDGFADQFGGPERKKFMNKKLKEQVIRISGKPMVEQRTELHTIFNEWKGKHSQVDDVCIIGIKI